MVSEGTVQAGKITHLRAMRTASMSLKVRRMHFMRDLLASDGCRTPEAGSLQRQRTGSIVDVDVVRIEGGQVRGFRRSRGDESVQGELLCGDVEICA